MDKDRLEWIISQAEADPCISRDNLMMLKRAYDEYTQPDEDTVERKRTIKEIINYHIKLLIKSFYFTTVVALCYWSTLIADYGGHHVLGKMISGTEFIILIISIIELLIIVVRMFNQIRKVKKYER